MRAYDVGTSRKHTVNSGPSAARPVPIPRWTRARRGLPRPVAIGVLTALVASAVGADVRVVEVEDGSPSSRAGLAEGDRLSAWGEGEPTEPLEDALDWSRLRRFDEAGRVGVVRIERDGDEPRDVATPDGLFGLVADVDPPSAIEEAARAAEMALRRARETDDEGERGSAFSEARERASELGALSDGGEIPLAWPWWFSMRLGRAFDDAGRLSEAAEVFEDAAALARRHGNRIAELDALVHRIGAIGLAGRHDELLESVAILLDSLSEEGEEALVRLRLLAWQSNSRRLQGDLIASGEAADEGLRLAEDLAPDSEILTTLLFCRTQVAELQGRLDEARELSARQVEILGRRAPKSENLVRALGTQGIIEWRAGNLDESERILRRALRMIEELAPTSSWRTGQMINLSLVEQRRGDYASSERLLRDALSLLEEHFPESRQRAWILGNLAFLTLRRGELDEAETRFREVLALFEAQAPESLEVAQTLNHLSEVARRQGRYDEARRLQLRSVELQQARTGESIDLAMALEGLGELENEVGDFTAARGFLLRALELREAQLPGSLALVNPLYRLAMASRGLGELDRALGELDRALRLQRERAPGGGIVIRLLHEIGRVRRDRGEHAAALASYEDAIDALESALPRLGGSEGTRSAFRAANQELYREWIELLIAGGEHAAAFEALERSRARQILDLLGERELRVSGLPDDLAREREELAAERDGVAERLEANDGDPLTLRRRLGDLAAEQRELVERIRAEAVRVGELEYPRPSTLEEARASLSPGTRALAWAVLDEETLLFVVGREHFELLRLPIGDGEVRARVRVLRQALREDPLGTRSVRTRALGHDLWQTLVGPASSALRDAERLLLVPDRSLHLLPWAALVDGEGRWWAEDRPFTTSVSMTLHAALGRLREREREGRDLVAFADPVLPASPEEASAEMALVLRSRNDLGPLPGSREEVTAIARLFDDPDVLLGSEATESAARHRATARFLHYAVHGVVDEDVPLQSGLVFSTPAGGQHDEERRDNGILQAWEILEDLVLDVDVVVLSACDTAVGREVDGEGLLGLTRAFQHAGAPTVIASLWPVADDGTAALMERVYEGLASGVGPAEALSRAQAALARGDAGRDLRAPFHWAGFVVVGRGD